MLVDAAILAGAVTMPRHRGCDKRRLLRGQCRHAGRQKTDRATPKDIASTCVEPACRFDASQDKGKKCCLWLCRDQPDVRDGHHSDFANFCYIADSDLSEIIKLYTIRVVYIPIIGILNLPGTYQLYNKIRAAKRNETDPFSLLSSLITPTENGLRGLDEIGTVLACAIMFLTAAVFTEAVIAWYGNRRFLSYLAVGAAGVLATFPLIGMGLPLYILNIYAHVQ